VSLVPGERRYLELIAAGHVEQDGMIAGPTASQKSDRGRATRPSIKLGVCGEHGGDPASIAWDERHARAS